MSEQRFESQPPVDLPQPSQEQVGQYGEASQAINSTEIAGARSVEQGVSTPAASVMGQASLMASMGDNNQPAGPLPQPDPAAPIMAEDSDLIEKEWVDRAKVIADRAKDDPYTQSKEINRMKADYLKKRYNKDIKLPED